MRSSFFLLLFLNTAIWSCTGFRSNAGYKEPEFIDEHTFKLTGISEDKSYGFIVENPVILGDKQGSIAESKKNEQRYLNALTGPNGEKVSFYKSGTCCAFRTSNSTYSKNGILRKYRVTWEGRPDTVTLFLNSYDYGTMKAPLGFGIKNQP